MLLTLLVGCSGNGDDNGTVPDAPDNTPDDTIAQPVQSDTPGTNDEVAGIRLQTVMIEIEGAPPVLWEEFFYDLWSVAGSLMQLGGPPDWDAPLEFGPFDESVSYSEFVLRIATELALSRRAIGILYAEIPTIHWGDNYEDIRTAEMERQGWTEAEFAASLWEHHRITENAFAYVNVSMGRRAALLQALYGEHGDETPDEVVALYAAEHDIVRAKHILFSTDAEFNDARAPETAGVRAAEVYEYLQTLSGAELLTRFDELMLEHGEDPGMEAHPDGYVFGPGSMTDAFFEGTLEIDAGTISEPIQTEFGYHIILRLPVLPTDELMGSALGPGGPLSQRAALFDFDRRIEVIASSLQYAFTAYYDQIDLNLVVVS
ncbi:MAG: peptidylprolyl isomerase [Oscillospiraceae bacterium]|nr:peptidylprolyl isomerase [Oscillospiraceae bacterium]